MSELNTSQKLRLVFGHSITLEKNTPFPPTKEEHEALVPGAAGLIIPTIKNKSVVLGDGPAGLRIAPPGEGKSQTDFYTSINLKENKYYSTAFPTGICVAATFDTSFGYEIGLGMGYDCCRSEVGCLLGPALNIHRHPLNGRNFEYYSEDPRLAGEMAKSVVEGIQSTGTAACIKHFAANNQETERRSVNVIMSERALREIYLENFRIALMANPLSLMTSYNKLNGFYTCQSKELMQILRNEMGYNGLVMTDWFAGDDAVQTLLADNNLIEPGTLKQYNDVQNELKTNSDLLRSVNSSVDKIISFTQQIQQKQDLVVNPKEIARKVAANGCVLLKNQHDVLPFSNGKIALFGTSSYIPFTTGIGSGAVNNEKDISIEEGFISANYQMNQQLQNIMKNHVKQQSSREQEMFEIFPLTKDYEEPILSNEIYEQIAKDSDLAVITIGRICGEFYDRKVNTFTLQPNEHQLIQQISTAFHNQNKRVVVLLNIGGPIEMESWKDYVDSILVVWFGGEQCGNAIVDIVSGKVNPSGRLPTTFPLSLDKVSGWSFPGNDQIKPTEVIHFEDIYVGYRYYTTFNIPVSYPFGFGLSYTKFHYDSITVSVDLDKKFITIQGSVKNIGNSNGKEVIQCYIGSPDGVVEKPKVELRRFTKTRVLSPNESMTFGFDIPFRDFASYNQVDNTWILDNGVYNVYINSDALTTIISSNFTLPNAIVVEKTNSLCSPPKQFKTLSKFD
ncbi:beta-glucosidase [Entamoeba marina]